MPDAPDTGTSTAVLALRYSGVTRDELVASSRYELGVAHLRAGAHARVCATSALIMRVH